VRSAVNAQKKKIRRQVKSVERPSASLRQQLTCIQKLSKRTEASQARDDVAKLWTNLTAWQVTTEKWMQETEQRTQAALQDIQRAYKTYREAAVSLTNNPDARNGGGTAGGAPCVRKLQQMSLVLPLLCSPFQVPEHVNRIQK